MQSRQHIALRAVQRSDPAIRRHIGTLEQEVSELTLDGVIGPLAVDRSGSLLNCVQILGHDPLVHLASKLHPARAAGPTMVHTSAPPDTICTHA